MVATIKLVFVVAAKKVVVATAAIQYVIAVFTDQAVIINRRGQGIVRAVADDRLRNRCKADQIFNTRPSSVER